MNTERAPQQSGQGKGAVDRWQAGLQEIAKRQGPFPIPEIDGGREALAQMSTAEIDQWLIEFEQDLVASKKEGTVDSPESVWDPAWGAAPRVFDSVDALLKGIPNLGKPQR